MSNSKNKIQGYLIPSPHGYILSKYKTILYPNATDERIRRIAKIIFNDPATIIIDIDGNKTVVKYQHDNGGYDRHIGWHVCLIRYLLDDPKVYHDVIDECFRHFRDSIITACLTSVIISQIGYDDYMNSYPDCTTYDED